MVSSVEATLGTVKIAALDTGKLLKRLCEGRLAAERDLLEKAFGVAGSVAQGRSRATGESLFTHACAVVDILSDLHLDSETLVAALLHNLVDEQGPLTPERVKQEFGERIAAIIAGSRKMRFMHDLPLGGAQGQPQDARQQMESLRKMLLAVVEDMRVVFVKLAERLHEMRMARLLPEDERRAVAQETLDIFTPLANRLGIWQVKWELEDLALRYLQPETYQRLTGLIDEKRADRENYVRQLVARLQEELRRLGILPDISGRAKHIYSIWRKMQRKGVDFHQVFDVLAVRVLVDSVGDCYTALGIVHSLWKPVPGEFDDYIARPKNNNYRSLHTAVEGPDQRIFEVQIRTRGMHQQAELGVAAHWKYKEGTSKHDLAFEEKIAWLRQLLEWKDEDGSAGEFLERFKSDLFEDHVYVLSPQGRIVDLPQGATPLDFAYTIHTSLGHRCRGAKINGRMVPLTYALKTGEQVEIVAGNKEQPSRDWLSEVYLKTARARGKVRQWLNQQDATKNLAEGRDILERILRRLNLAEVNWEQLAQRLHFRATDEMLGALGRGDLTGTAIANAVRELILPPPEEEDALTVSASHGDAATGAVQVDGLDGLLSHTAKCCQPVPDEPVIGYITRERGIAIHRRGCPNVARWEEEGNQRLIEVEWSKAGARVYPVDILVRAYDRTGLLRDISEALTGEKINIIAVDTKTGRDLIAVMRLTLEVHDVDQLSRALERIEKLSNVMEAVRR